METSSSEYGRAIHDHYGSKPILQDILKQLRIEGIDPAKVQPENLYAYDQFHMGRVGASRRLAELSNLSEGSFILDLGCGIGGTTRVFAHEKKYRMVAMDLTELYIHAATALTKLVRLTEGTNYLHAEGTYLPFTSEAYDGVVMQHATVNIPNKGLLFREVSRVLKTGGVLVLHDWLRGDRADPIYPMPWSADGSISYLVKKEEFTSIAAETGFAMEIFQDLAEPYVARLKQQIEDAQKKRRESTNTGETKALLSLEESLTPFYRNLSDKRLVCYMARLRKVPLSV